MLDILGFNDRQTGARAIVLAGLLDRLIFKYRLSPENVVDAGIPLRHLLPTDTIFRFPTERLNHLIRRAKSAYKGVASDPLLMLWLEKWADLLPPDLRLQIDSTNDRSHLVEPEYLAALFGSELKPLRGISIKSRNKPFFALGPRLPIYGAGSLGDRNQGIPPPDFSDAATDDEGSSRLVVFGPTDARLDALSSYLADEARPPAAAAIFLQGAAERHEVTGHLLHAAMEKSGLAFAAAVRVHPDDASAWMDFLASAYLRHGNLDEVLMQAFHQIPVHHRDAGDPSPLVLVGESFLDREVTDPRHHIDDLLEAQLLVYRDYNRVEAYGAAPMAAQLAELKHIPAVRQAMKRRYVQLNVHPEGENVPVTVLYPASSYSVELYIDAVVSTSSASPLPLPLDGMSFDSGPEELTVAFVPLYGMGDTQHTAGQTAKLRLPAEGPSTFVTFALRTPGVLSEFRVRIIVTHRSAVLQTLILGLEPIAGDPDMGLPFRIVVESDVTRANSIARPEPLEFDLTLVLNHNPAGTPGATVIDKMDRALFAVPQGWQQFLEDTQDIIGELTDAAELPDSLDDADLNTTLRELAWAGCTALEKLTEQASGVDFASARNIQVIEAISGAFIPIEFFYDGPPPDDDARLCVNAASALERGACAAACAGNLSEATICPLSFWGLTKRIERRSSSNESRDIELRIPKDAPPARRTLNTALLGASVKVKQRDYDHLHDKLRSHLSMVYRASDWQAWRSSVTNLQPELLVLLPHTGPHPCGTAQLSMEIHSKHIRFAQLQGKDVTANTGHEPVVLLLGCETAAAKRVQLMNFASKFYSKGAFVVIATLSAVRGRYVANFAAELTERLKSNAHGTPSDFGTTFLALKRELLAAGNALGLTMIAYGDTAWEIDHE